MAGRRLALTPQRVTALSDRLHRTDQERPPLLSLSPGEVATRLGGSGRSRAVYRALSNGDDPFADGSLAPGAQKRLAEALSPTAASVESTLASRDGTLKMLIRLGDGLAVEAVLIPSRSRSTLCVSSQVGCARGCDFCLTATMGLVRNLSCDEIVAQVVVALRVARDAELPALRNIVFMGMGEPLDNLSAVAASLSIITADECLGFGPRHMTVSTVGTTARAIERAATLPCRLAWSLHAADDAVRSGLIPTARASASALRDAFMNALDGSGRPLFVECCLIDGLNDRERDALALVELFRDVDVEVRVNLLALNPIGRPDLGPSPPDRVARFGDIVRTAGHFCTVRTPRGQLEGAACGQLAVVT